MNRRCRVASLMTLGGYRTKGLGTRSAAGEGKQGDVARALDGYAEPALMARADASHAARKNLAALLDELRKNVGALVVDHVHLLDTELADLLFAEVLTLAARTAAGTSRTAGTTFATRATVATAGTAFAARGAATGVGLCWFLFVCHNVCLSLWGRAGVRPYMKLSKIKDELKPVVA